MGFNNKTDTYETFNDIRLSIGESSSSITVLGQYNPYDSKGGTFLWKNDLNYPDDNYTIIKPFFETQGRWVRMSEGDILSGRIMFSGDGFTTSFTHTLEQNLLNNDYIIILQHLTLDAISEKYSFTKSANSITINYIMPPPVGTGNIQFDYIIRYTPNILDL